MSEVTERSDLVLRDLLLEVVTLSVLDITPMGEVRWSGVTRHPNERYVISCNGSEVRHRDGVRRGRPNHSYHWDRASVAGDTVGEVVSLSVLDTDTVGGLDQYHLEVVTLPVPNTARMGHR